MDPFFTAGRHEAMLVSLTNDVAGIKEDIAGIKGILAERRGERKIGSWVMHTITAVLGASAALFARHLGAH